MPPAPAGLSSAASHLGKRDQLLQLLASYKSCGVAFSGGVDSAVLAKAAQLALADRAVAVTGVSPSLAEGQLEEARRLAAQIGIRHVELATGELANPQYAANGPDRCYHCKTELYVHVEGLAEELGVEVLANGGNADDASDYRPGTKAAEEHAVRSPLAECGFTKDDVRRLARQWALPVWDRPASPCLSSRIAYGEQVTAERLAMVDRAEQCLRKLGLTSVRVRYHKSDLARLEVPVDAIERICQEGTRRQLVAELRALGFKFITLDLEGFRSGSLNQVIPVESLG